MPSDIHRKPSKFTCNGIDLVHPPDMMPEGYYPYLQNVRSVIAGTVEVRPGYQPVNATALNSGAPIHSIRRVNNLLPGAASPAQIFVGTGTSLYSGPPAGPFTSIASGFSGNPLSTVIFRPDQSPESWIYIADQNKMVKANCEQVVRNVGIAPPTAAPTPEITSATVKIINDFTSAAGWTDDGAVVTSLPAVVARVPASTTVSDILYDSGTSGWAIISPQNLSGSYAFLQPGARLILGGVETVTVQDVTSDIPATTIAGIIYDSGTTGACSVSLTTQTPQLTRNSLVLLSTTSIVRVLSVTVGPDGLSSFRCIDPNPHVAGDAVRTIVGFRVFTTTTISVGAAITGDALEFTLTKAGTGYISLPITLDLSQAGGRPLRPDDYIHLSVRMTAPGNMVSGQLLFDVDAVTNDFTQNYYYKNLLPSDLQSNSTGTLDSTTTLQSAIQIQLVNEQAAAAQQNNDFAQSYGPGGFDYGSPYIPSFDPGSQQQVIDSSGSANSGGIDTSALSNAAVAATLSTGSAQWTELFIKIADLVRVGTDATVNLANVAAIRVAIVATGAVTVDISSWWAGGTYGPDVQQNSPVGIQYQYRYRDTRTGARSVPSPPCRYQLFPLRQKINVGVTASTDPQVNVIDIQRFDPGLATLVYVGSTPNTTGTVFIDDTQASLIAGNPSFETNVFQPWPVLDTPKTGVVNVAGTSVKLVSGDVFQTSLQPGTVITIGNNTADATQVYGQPSSTTFLQITTNLGALTNVPYTISAPTLLGQPLPVMFGPLEGPTAVYSFGIGDPRNPGTLYWTNGNDLDSASDQNTIEITSPSEPLVAGCVWQTLIFVASARRVFLVTPSFATSAAGQTTVVFTSTELTSISGSFSAWGMCKGAQGVYMIGRDGIYNLNYNSGAYFSQQIYPLFPHDGQPALVTNSFVPVDMTASSRLRLSYCDAALMFDYADTSANQETFEIDPNGGFWPHDYADPVLTHYWEEVPEGIETRMLMGTSDGFLLASGGIIDGAVQLHGIARTPSYDFGDPRTLKLFMDQMTDADAGGGYTVTAGFNNYTVTALLGTQAAVAGRQQFLNSISSVAAAGLVLYRNIAAQYVLGAGTVLYEFEPSFYLQPFSSMLYTTQLMDHGIPGWKQLRYGRFALISTNAVQIQILNDDGAILNNLTIPSTGGILFNDFVQLENASKGRLLRYSATSSSEFVLFTDKTYIRMKKWGGDQFLEVQPFLQ